MLGQQVLTIIESVEHNLELPRSTCLLIFIAMLTARLAEAGSGDTGRSGLDALAGSFLSCLLDKFDDRNPRGSIELVNEAPATFQTRGVRTFHFDLDTGKGRLFLLAEVPSRAELDLAKGSEFMASMESIYLPADWHGSRAAK